MTHSLRLKCYNCGAIMRAVERQAGKRSRCAACKSPLRIPAATIFAQYDGQKVQAPKEPEWDFQYLKDKQPKDPGREDFIGEVTSSEDEEELFFGGPVGAAAGEESEIGESEPASLVDSAVDEGDLADAFATAGTAAAENEDLDTVTDSAGPWEQFNQTVEDESEPVANVDSSIATPSLMDMTDDASVAAAAAAEAAAVGSESAAAIEDDGLFDDSGVADAEATLEDRTPDIAQANVADAEGAEGASSIATPSLMDMTGDASVAAAAAAEEGLLGDDDAVPEPSPGLADSNVFDDDMTLPDDSEVARPGPERPMSEVEDDFRTEEFTRTVDDGGQPIAIAGTGTEADGDDDLFEPLGDEQAPAVGELPDLQPADRPEGSVVEFGDSDIDLETPGANTGNEADLQALLDDFDDELDG